jgi:hypothetical protein
MADGSVIDRPDPQAVSTWVGRLSSANWYAILERGPEHYLQAGVGRNAGVPGGRYALERRDGSAERHYRGVVVSLDVVVEAFVGFASGRLDWAERLDWQRVVL